jgi:diguanylate cyclase (GGDEF)-like protein
MHFQSLLRADDGSEMNMPWRQILLALFLTWASLTSARAAVLFERVGDPLSIPDGVITAVAQDGRGFLWIGTPEALIRYDGHRFRRYVHDPLDPGSPPSDRIFALMTASDGRLWVGFQTDGVAVYDPDRDRFVRHALPTAEGDDLAGAQVRALAETPDGAVWVGTTGRGLVRIDREGGIRVFRNGPGLGSLPDDRVGALGVDHAGVLWVGTWRGLARLRSIDADFEPVLSDSGDPLGFGAATVRGIHAARNGNLWVGAQQGLVAMIPANQLGHVRLPDAGAVRRWRADGFYTAIEPADDEVWLGHAVGIDVFAADGSGEPRRVRHDTAEPLSLANAEVRGLLVDRSGLVWVGTFGGGLLRANPASAALVSRRFDRVADAPLEQLNALTLAAAAAGGFWAGIARNGVARFDQDLRIVEILGRVGRDDGLSGSQPSGIAESTDGSLWVATESGIHVRSAGEARFEVFSGPEFVEASAVRKIMPLEDGGLWVATGDGLFGIDGSRQLRRLATSDGRRVGGVFNAIAIDPSGGGWAGSNEGLFRISPVGALEPVEMLLDGVAFAAPIQGVLVDRSGSVWIDADGLLRIVQLDGARAAVETISRRHGFAKTAFGANLLDDEQGRIWTHRFMYDPARDLMVRIGRADGALVGTGWFRAYARLADGRFAFGATEGLLVVDPRRFRAEPSEQPLAFTDLRIDGRARPVGARPSVIEVKPGDRNVSLEFAALDYGAPTSRRYRYRLDGVDGDWLEVDSTVRVASYGGLWPGSYRLMVQASRRGGGWGEDVLVVELRVLPKWWQTPLGIAGILGGIVGLAVFFGYRREGRLRREKVRLEREVEGRTVELRSLSTELARRNIDLRQASLTDPLTGLRNRRYVTQEFPGEVARLLAHPVTTRDGSQVGNEGLVLFLIDIDGFKSVNDQHGHAAGDVVLRQFADRLRTVFRDSDEFVRWGGEEFLVVARGIGSDAAAGLAERVRERVARDPFVLDDGTPVSRTCCIGFAPFPFEGARPRAHGWEAVMEVADQALLAAKRLGRDAWIGVEPAESALIDGSIGNWDVAALVRSGKLRVVTGPSNGADRAAAALAEVAGLARMLPADGAA